MRGVDTRGLGPKEGRGGKIDKEEREGAGGGPTEVGPRFR